MKDDDNGNWAQALRVSPPLMQLMGMGMGMGGGDQQAYADRFLQPCQRLIEERDKPHKCSLCDKWFRINIAREIRRMMKAGIDPTRIDDDQEARHVAEKGVPSMFVRIVQVEDVLDGKDATYAYVCPSCAIREGQDGIERVLLERAQALGIKHNRLRLDAKGDVLPDGTA